MNWLWKEKNGIICVKLNYLDSSLLSCANSYIYRASGLVYSAIEKKTGEKCAIKMCSIDEMEQLVSLVFKRYYTLLGLAVYTISSKIFPVVECIHEFFTFDWLVATLYHVVYSKMRLLFRNCVSIKTLLCIRNHSYKEIKSGLSWSTWMEVLWPKFWVYVQQ